MQCAGLHIYKSFTDIENNMQDTEIGHDIFIIDFG